MNRRQFIKSIAASFAVCYLDFNSGRGLTELLNARSEHKYSMDHAFAAFANSPEIMEVKLISIDELVN